jgi:hypothetical protein
VPADPVPIAACPADVTPVFVVVYFMLLEIAPAIFANLAKANLVSIVTDASSLRMAPS